MADISHGVGKVWLPKENCEKEEGMLGMSNSRDGPQSHCPTLSQWLFRILIFCNGEENGNPLQYSCLKNLMDREAWWSTVQRVTKEPDMTEATEHASVHAYFVNRYSFDTY